MTNEQIELLNRIKEDVSKDNGLTLRSWGTDIALAHRWQEVCRRYAEEVNNEIPLLKHKIDLFEKAEIEWRNIVQKKKDKISELEAEITRLKESREKSIMASLEKAADNAVCTYDEVMQDSITDKSNIVIVE